MPFWIDASEQIENDPYSTDCTAGTTANNPHAYTEFSIQNGALESVVCIEKPPGKLVDVQKKKKLILF